MKNNTTQGLFGALLIGLSFLSTNSICNAQTGGATFKVGSPMKRGKIYPMASALSNGKIISFGGRETGFVSCAFADVYDIAADTFSEIEMNYTHDMGTVCKLSNGNYFIAGGGQNLGVPAYNTTEMYDVATNSFTAKASMQSSRMMSASVQLKSGKVLIAGAWYSNSAAAYGELYDPITNGFSATGGLKQARAQAILLPTADGGAVLAGGWSVYGGTVYTSSEYYDITNNEFTSLNSQLIPTDSGWMLNAIYTRPIDDSRMSNGNYILLAYRSNPDLEFALLEFNPSTKLFSKLITSQPISDSLTNGGFFDLVLNRAENKVYLLGVKASTNPGEICLLTVNLSSGKVNFPQTSFTLPSQEYPNPCMTYLNANGKILLQGISSAPDNFHATNKTYLLTPQIYAGIDNVSYSNSDLPFYPNPASNFVYIKTNKIEIGEAVIHIYNMLGELIKTENLSDNIHSIDVSQLESGMYTIELISRGHCNKQKLIIQN